MSIVRPTRPFTALPPDFAGYILDLERWADHIDQLHANQTRTGMDNQRTIDELRAVNETQMGRIEALIIDRDLHIDQAARLRVDIDIIREELQSEAEQRDWCDDYRRFADRVNERLTLGRIGPELREYRTMHTYEVTITGSVMAANDDDARQRADQQYGSIREARIMSIPDDDTDALSHDDRGTLINVRWMHKDTTAHNPHTQEG